MPLLGHHTSGVRSEWYRDDLEIDLKDDPFPKLRNVLLDLAVSESSLDQIKQDARVFIDDSFARAVAAADGMRSEI